ncbi:hypothetical protein TIFTF001_027331 [Ficus carica]|uniref:Uncharacterized protein n=1 Tax=Ficus carica TaxID=3494 RepID=A0AA88DMV7_FICCA|nr:hypothetical protein TIFTF001_027331 [Ficus carica]
MLSILFQTMVSDQCLEFAELLSFCNLRGCSGTDDSEDEAEARQDAGGDDQNCITNVKLQYFLLIFLPF